MRKVKIVKEMPEENTIQLTELDLLFLLLLKGFSLHYNKV